MNSTINAILNRRSVRSYSHKQIKNEELELILKAGLYAPSAHNQQPWHFTVIQDKKIIKNLNLAAKQVMLELENESLKKYAEDEHFDIFYDVPTIIVISGEKSAIIPDIDCAAATQNMLLAAESLNIGSCWIGLVRHLFMIDKVGEYIKLFNIPEGFEPYYAITLGYKTIEDKPAPPRRENTVNYIR
ncbi:MAG TPA: nitroreductase family protein [Candidatus Gastranaerophilales bacterium]|nr:nitroreductase family protein [Candidatus Gastranaerophilales bacterium]